MTVPLPPTMSIRLRSFAATQQTTGNAVFTPLLGCVVPGKHHKYFVMRGNDHDV